MARREVQDLVGVVAGQGHLGGPHKVKVVFSETVDLGVVLDVKTGALHGLGTHQRGGDQRNEAGLDGRSMAICRRAISSRAPTPRRK